VSLPPEAVLGAEERTGMRIFSRASARRPAPPSPATAIERLGIDGMPFEMVASFILRKAGYSYCAIAHNFSVSTRTVRRWVERVAGEIG
jgi:DNA-directed RNA polymerase specialized sigma24 family protein